jgi:hypothetical protein
VLPRLITVLLILATRPALACPDCPTSRVVTALVLGGGAWVHLGVTVLPFLVLGATIAVIRRAVR